ncbi:MAG TPA: hypothetical protein VF576_11815 [Rubricoccaceae bacterium]|jgi:hypothetical protein
MTTIFAESDVTDDVQALDVPDGATAADVADHARSAGLTRDGDDPVVYLEDEDEPVAPGVALPISSGHCRVHVGPRARIDVTVHYNGRHVGQGFSPAATVERVHRWAADQLGLSETEAARHKLQFCDTTDQPKPRRHLGALDRNRDRELCLDLVPARRTQGAGASGALGA